MLFSKTFAGLYKMKKFLILAVLVLLIVTLSPTVSAELDITKECTVGSQDIDFSKGNFTFDKVIELGRGRGEGNYWDCYQFNYNGKPWIKVFGTISFGEWAVSWLPNAINTRPILERGVDVYIFDGKNWIYVAHWSVYTDDFDKSYINVDSSNAEYLPTFISFQPYFARTDKQKLNLKYFWVNKDGFLRYVNLAENAETIQKTAEVRIKPTVVDLDQTNAKLEFEYYGIVLGKKVPFNIGTYTDRYGVRSPYFSESSPMLKMYNKADQLLTLSGSFLNKYNENPPLVYTLTEAERKNWIKFDFETKADENKKYYVAFEVFGKKVYSNPITVTYSAKKAKLLQAQSVMQKVINLQKKLTINFSLTPNSFKRLTDAGFLGTERDFASLISQNVETITFGGIDITSTGNIVALGKEKIRLNVGLIKEGESKTLVIKTKRFDDRTDIYGKKYKGGVITIPISGITKKYLED